MPKKYIITKLFAEATGMPDAAIAAYKVFMRASFGETTFAKIEFEVITVEDNERIQVDRLLQSVRSEFAVHDQAEAKPEQKSTDEQH